MRKVFPNREVAHIWAQQKQDEGRGSSFYFNGPTIYSYGSHFPIARFVDKKTVLFTTRTYSVTTSTHLGYARNALQGLDLEIFHVREVATAHHEENIIEMIKDIDELQRKAMRAVKNGEWLRREAEARKAEMIRFQNRFEVKIKDDIIGARFIEIVHKELFSDDEKAKIKARIKEETLAEKKRKEVLEKKLEEGRQEWRQGIGDHFPDSWDKDFPTELRVKNDEVQTSRGASIPLSIARKVWERLTNNKNLGGMNLGNYTVAAFDGMTLMVGCHKIALTEMQRLADVLGWK